jgi:hypothetical protein
MSWLFSQVLVEEYLGDISSDGEQSVQSSGNPTQQAYCAPDKMTAFSRLSRFGMTYKPLTEDRGEKLLTWFRAASHAKTSPQPEKVRESTQSEAECGEKWRGWLAKYDPDSCSWRTAQCSLLEDLNECLETLPRSGMTRDGLLWELPMLAHHTRETESGLSERIPTPLQSDWKRRGPASQQQGLPEYARKWPTPTAHNAKEGAFPAEYNRKTPALAAEVGGQLNPNWVEWLMGWPVGWTDLKPLETDRFQRWLDEHGKS